MRKFREGGYNTLVATCVGEEGLDIGEVDLIVCFDAAKSPIRLVQRLGRTGRRRSGRIVVIVSEGKEEQIYNKSQSSKKSIHKAIREGCKKLDFFLQRCPRMVPRHINPQPHKMHMTVDKFVPMTNGRRKNGGVPGAAKSKSGATNSAKGKGKQRAKHAFLTDQQLACWSKELSLSDREFRAIEKSVEKCYAKKMPFLSSKKAVPTIAGAPQGSQHASFDSSFVQPNDTSANTSGLSSRMALSLSRWIHFQTAPVQTKVVGHSSTTSLLTSCLEFSDLLKISEGMGASYDLEMQTFLDRRDVEEEATGEVPSGERMVGKDKKKVSKGKKPVRVFVDSSDDEDFIMPAKTAMKGQEPVSVDLVCGDERVEESSAPHEEADGYGGGACDDMVGHDEPIPKIQKGDVVLTSSQHVVPRAPSESLDWLDDLASQSEPWAEDDAADPNQHADGNNECVEGHVDYEEGNEQEEGNAGHEEVTRVCSPSSAHLSSGDTGDEHDPVEIPEKNFVFVTPKPPRSKRSRIANPPSCSTPKTHGNASLQLNHELPTSSHDPGRSQGGSAESIDLFDDLSSQALFDDFSVSLQGTLKSTGECSTSAAVKESPAGIKGIFSGVKSSQLRSICDRKDEESVGGSKTPPTGEVTVICESDIEDEEDEGQVLFHPPGRSSTACRSSPGEESYVLHHRRRKRKACILESPQNDGWENSELGSSRKMSTRDKSSANALQSSRKESSPVSRLKSSAKGAAPGDSNIATSPLSRSVAKSTAKRVVINLDPSDDEDFQAPLMKRLCCSRKTLRSATKGSGGDQPSSQDHTLNEKHSRSGNASSHNQGETCDFIEDEAELSQFECSQYRDDREVQDVYDMDDSFINDNSMLTQYTQAQPRPRKVKSSDIGTDMYKQSLISPKDKIFGRRKGQANEGRYRMVLSQRHQILNHYMDKAGFKRGTDDEVERGWYRKRRAGGKLDVSSSGSEAEEVDVAYGEEDMEELSQSPVEDDDLPSTPNRTRGEVTPQDGQTDASNTFVMTSVGGGRTGRAGVSKRDGTTRQKRIAGFLSDSDVEEECHRVQTSPVGNAGVSAVPRTIQSHDPEPKTGHTKLFNQNFQSRMALQKHRTVQTPVEARSCNLKPRGMHLSSEPGSSCDSKPCSEPRYTEDGFRIVDISKFKDVIISPSLHVCSGLQEYIALKQRSVQPVHAPEYQNKYWRGWVIWQPVC